MFWFWGLPALICPKAFLEPSPMPTPDHPHIRQAVYAVSRRSFRLLWKDRVPLELLRRLFQNLVGLMQGPIKQRTSTSFRNMLCGGLSSHQDASNNTSHNLFVLFWGPCKAPNTSFWAPGGPNNMVLGTNDAPRTFEVLSAFSRLSTLGHETVYVAGFGSQAHLLGPRADA